MLTPVNNKIYKALYPFCKKYKELILYLFVGGCTVVVAISIFAYLTRVLNINPLYANAVSWVTGVLFSFFTTRRWVFQAHKNSFSVLLKQLFEFCSARALTLLLQEVLIYIFIIKLNLNSMVVKICTEIINIILNYLVSKFIIFRQR